MELLQVSPIRGYMVYVKQTGEYVLSELAEGTGLSLRTEWVDRKAGE